MLEFADEPGSVISMASSAGVRPVRAHAAAIASSNEAASISMGSLKSFMFGPSGVGDCGDAAPPRRSLRPCGGHFAVVHDVDPLLLEGGEDVVHGPIEDDARRQIIHEEKHHDGHEHHE